MPRAQRRVEMWSCVLEAHNEAAAQLEIRLHFVALSVFSNNNCFQKANYLHKLERLEPLAFFSVVKKQQRNSNVVLISLPLLRSVTISSLRNLRQRVIPSAQACVNSLSYWKHKLLHNTEKATK